MWRKATHAITYVSLWVMPWLILAAVVWGIWYGLHK